MKTLLILLSALSISLVGCSSVEPSRNGPAIDIFPVEHNLSIKVSSTNLEAAKKQLALFIHQNKQILLTQTVKLDWRDNSAKTLFQFAKSHLLDLGVPPYRILESSTPSAAKNRFNFEIQVIQYQVSDRTCEEVISQDYFLADDGCFTENARWKSMVAPERMFPSLQRVQE
ncbi:hypothetical protein [Marinomonas ostreistagni]|uniref:Lipoprotein n=1 Tax=Marinomonas ostreistagni TaxID=359209 RepID=A0ABS0ZCT0_9GAMM|nr:hypothetical protein [Marinomonas ostreistagni]MBJ7551479.1 hypothetical protein [Marinomonas ostreistagni]